MKVCVNGAKDSLKDTLNISGISGSLVGEEISFSEDDDSNCFTFADDNDGAMDFFSVSSPAKIGASNNDLF